jgi:hypothetical protein
MTFNLGIIGRCLSCQPWIKISDLYHKKLKEMFLKIDGINFRVSIASHSELEPCERLKILYTKKPLDGILYHMRLCMPQVVLYSKKDESGKYSYTLNNFFKQFLDKDKLRYSMDNDVIQRVIKLKLNRDLHDMFDLVKDTPLERKFFGIPLHKLNLLAGKLCGINSWVIKNELRYFERLLNYSLELKMPVFVLGPIPEFHNLQIKNLNMQKKMERIFKKKILECDIPNYFLNSLYDENGSILFKKDQEHLSSEGHAFLARELYPILLPWIRSILKNK